MHTAGCIRRAAGADRPKQRFKCHEDEDRGSDDQARRVSCASNMLFAGNFTARQYGHHSSCCFPFMLVVTCRLLHHDCEFVLDRQYHAQGSSGMPTHQMKMRGVLFNGTIKHGMMMCLSLLYFPPHSFSFLTSLSLIVFSAIPPFLPTYLASFHQYHILTSQLCGVSLCMSLMLVQWASTVWSCPCITNTTQPVCINIARMEALDGVCSVRVHASVHLHILHTRIATMLPCLDFQVLCDCLCSRS